MKQTLTHSQATLRVVCLAFALLFTSFLLRAQPGTIDPSFNPIDRGFGMGDGFYPGFSVMSLQPDGKILIAGSHFTYNGTFLPGIARLNPDGSLDPSFDPGTGIHFRNSISSIALQPDGKILIGGDFTSYNGTVRVGFARLNADGSLDTSFDTGSESNRVIYKLTLQPDGKIIIVGSFYSYNGTPRKAIARLHADGSLDTTFDPGTGGPVVVRAMITQPDGKILIGGMFSTYNGTTRRGIVRLNADGSLDTGFDPGTGANGEVKTMALQPDGKILIGGLFTSYNGTGRNHIARLNADGSLDTGFDPGTGAEGGDSGIASIALLPDGKVLIGGDFRSYNGTAWRGIARLNANGSLDSGFNPVAGIFSGYAITLQPDGRILIGASFLNNSGTDPRGIARLNADGSLDTSFNPSTGVRGFVNSITLQPDRKILIGGGFTSYNGIARKDIARLNADGSLDLGFDPGMRSDNSFYALALQPDGKILIGSSNLMLFKGTVRRSIARLNPDGSLDMGFNLGNGANSTVQSVALQPDGKILIGGLFTSYNGTARNRIARLNADGSLDTGFDPGAGANSTVQSVTLQPDGKILIGGSFSSYNGTARNRIARLNADGSLDTGFDPDAGANNTIQEVVKQPDGKILIGGEFTSYNGTAHNRIARLNANGSLDTGFNPGMGANGSVRTLVLNPDGKILIGGLFTSFNGTARNRLARLNADGSLDAGFDPGTGANQSILDVALQPDGQILIGGVFTSYNGTGRNRIARINGGGDGTPPTQCLALGDACSGNGQEIQRYTLNVPSGGTYPLALTYRSHERATQLRLRINGGSWQNFPLAQTPSDLAYLTTDLGGMTLLSGANTLELASGGGFICFRQLCTGGPVTPPGACLALEDACSGNEQEIRRFTLNSASDGTYPLALTYRSHERATQLRLRINGGSWQTLPLAQTPSDLSYATTNLGSLVLQRGANSVELASGGGYVCFRQLCTGAPVTPPGACLALGDECSGNDQEIRRYALNIATEGAYPLTLMYRSHERATQLRLRINGGNWQAFSLAQTPSDLTYQNVALGSQLLQTGANSVELASGGGFICFRQLCTGTPFVDASRIGLGETYQEESQELTVSPNPNNGDFEARFYTEPDRAAVLEVVDMQGRRLWRKGLRGEGWHNERVSLPHAAAGTYLLLLHPDEPSAQGRPEYKRVVVVK